MSFIYKFYSTSTLGRYDKDIAIPYFKVEDFPNLKKEEHIFKNRLGLSIHYFYYYYPNYNKDKIILFLTGIGPGHTAHFREIEYFAKAGYKILTLDYLGTGTSEGKGLLSLNEPSEDVIELLDFLNLKEEILVFGHSLGGYTALNVIKLREEIKTGIIMSGFISISRLIKIYNKVPLVPTIINHYETRFLRNINTPNNIKFLKSTTKRIMFIHSTDDKKVDYKLNFLKVKSLNNKNLTLVTVEDKNHNPNYTIESRIYKDKIIDTYFAKLNNHEFKSLEERIDYFKDVSLDKLTTQDTKIMDKFLEFFEK